MNNGIFLKDEDGDDPREITLEEANEHYLESIQQIIRDMARDMAAEGHSRDTINAAIAATLPKLEAWRAEQYRALQSYLLRDGATVH